MPDNFEIIHKWVLILTPLPLLLYFIVPALKIKSASLLIPNMVKSSEYTKQKPSRNSLIPKKHFFEIIMLSFVWVLLLLSLSSPQLVGKAELKPKNSRNFLIVADLSFSMAQKDWKIENKPVTRWEAVTSVMNEFIEKREGDRMGLVLFGSNAYVQAPFTPDLITVKTMLDEAAVGLAGQTTSIGKAIMKGIDLFDKDTIKTKVMLLLTDGVDAGIGVLPLDAADIAKRDSILIYTIGIGDPNSGNSDLDEKTLEEIAEITGGQYFRAINTDRLNSIYEELDKLEPIEYEEESYRPRTLLYPYPLGLAIVLFLCYALFAEIISFYKKQLKSDEND
ncbi:VWA domain-containing protein [Flavicella marina]|uniref:VWA domain-containing protein n=1 Tax=Flavicella marina TaxID=1475951 RepID=UPI00126537F7|nr:VWA domain-containing protein [Flavicella marina]